MQFRVTLVFVWLASGLCAEVTVGSTRDEVIAEFGPPRGTTKAGAKEILTYPGGRVSLEEGRVTLSTITGAPTPAPVVPGPSASTPALLTPPAPLSAPAAMALKSQALAEITGTADRKPAIEPWLLNFEAAKLTAAREQKRILVLFTGTDWCPPCQEFQAEVAYDPTFLKTFSPSFVFMKVDWLRNSPQPKAEAEQTARLRQQYGIATFPSLLVLAADGTQLMRVDTRKGRPGSGMADYFIQAIDEARQATRDGQPVKSNWWPF